MPVRIASATGRRTGRRSDSPMRLLLLGVLVVAAIAGGAVATGAVQLQRPDDGGPADRAGSGRDGSWSYYHDTDYVSDAGGAKWETDHSRSTDPAEAALGDTSRWEYEGPYRYGSYGSNGMRQRSAGRETVDPLYSQGDAALDVFTQSVDLDPSGGQPVGAAPSSLTNPYYDPYAGYSNPYANRIRLGYGEGIGRGANVEFPP